LNISATQSLPRRQSRRNTTCARGRGNDYFSHLEFHRRYRYRQRVILFWQSRTSDE
jgi:hypothetical protein